MYSLKKNSRIQVGFSLIELLLVLGIVCILLVASFVIYPQVRDARLGNDEAARFSATAAGLSAYYAEVPSHEPPPSAIELLEAGVLTSGDFWDGKWVSLERKPIVLELKDGAWALGYDAMSPSLCGQFLPQVRAYHSRAFQAMFFNGKDITNASIEALGVECDQAQKPVSLRFQFKHGNDGLARSSNAPSQAPRSEEFVDPKGKTWGTSEGM